MERNVFRTFLNQSFFQFLAKTTSLAAGFVFSLMISRFLGAEIFGQFSLIQSILSMVIVFCIIGLPLTGQRFVSRASDDPSRQFDYVKLIVRNYLLLFAVTGAILFFGLDWLAELFEFPSLIEHSALILGILFVFGAWEIFVGIFKGYKKIQVNAFQSALLGLAKVGCFGLFYPFMGRSLSVALASFLAGYALVDAAYLFFVWSQNITRSTSWIEWDITPETKNKLWRYSLIIFMTNIVATVLTQTDRLMIGYFLENKDVGFYTAAFKWSGFLLILVQIARPISGSMFSEFQEAGDNRSIVRLYFYVLKFSLLLSFPLFVCFWLYPGWFLGFFGAEFTVAGSAFQYLSLVKLAQLMAGPVGMALVMSGLETWDFYTNFVLAGLNFLLNLLLIPAWGITGAALATLTSWSIMLVCKFVIFAVRKGFFQHLTIGEIVAPFLILGTFPLYWLGQATIFREGTLVNVFVVVFVSGVISLVYAYLITDHQEWEKFVSVFGGQVTGRDG